MRLHPNTSGLHLIAINHALASDSAQVVEAFQVLDGAKVFELLVLVDLGQW